MGCSASTAACTSTSTDSQRQRDIALFYALEEMGCDPELVFAARQQNSEALEDARTMETLTVVIKKEEGVPFGVELRKRKDEEVAIVMKIDTDGYLKTWNRKYPTNALRLGDRIVAVNDCRNDFWQMLAQLRYLREFRLTVERDPLTALRQQRSGSRLHSAEGCSKLANSVFFDHLQVTRAGDETANECAVCLEEYSDPEMTVVVLPCSHVFHSACIGRWLCKGGKFCPLCKAALSDTYQAREIIR
mmetsp:Transcript_12404/g.20280  ORF Transcript_12404/g.20280 Transcript_12404/m.20280 type:complete len:246 (-) Transcript_12404:526-1263(-)